MTNTMEGQKVPAVTFHTRQNDEWVDVTTDDLFKGKTVVVFALPGAFTPTCSSSHLPRYDALAPVLKEHGVDDILCVSVNDTFVMNAWADQLDMANITMVPDGSGKFTEGVGQLVNKDDLGFGMRSWRYSMLVRDGVIEKMFIEPDEPGDPFVVSDADTMLNYINANAEVPPAVSIITKPGCAHCTRAKRALKGAGLDFEEIVLGEDATAKSLAALSGASTTPQIFMDGKRIGGADDLEAYLAAEAA
ncbi:MAG: glutathione peroxidase [Alphaproteobacteria bacterium]